MHVEIPEAVLRRAAAAMSDDETRHYLCGVRVAAKGQYVRVQATSGHILYLWRGPNEEGADFDVIIPDVAIKAALKHRKRVFAYEVSADKITSPDVPHGIAFTPVDGRFPDVSLALPKSTSGERAWFDPGLLMRIAEAIGGGPKTREKSLRVLYNGEDAAYVQDDLGLWVIMPMRYEFSPARDCAALIEEYL